MISTQGLNQIESWPIVKTKPYLINENINILIILMLMENLQYGTCLIVGNGTDFLCYAGLGDQKRNYIIIIIIDLGYELFYLYQKHFSI